MQSAQDRILAAIEQKITALAVYEVAKQHSYANTGTVYIYRKAEPLHAIGSIDFDFQVSNYKLSITWQGKRIPSQPGRFDYFDFYQKYDAPSAFWSTLQETIRPKLKKTA